MDAVESRVIQAGSRHVRGAGCEREVSVVEGDAQEASLVNVCPCKVGASHVGVSVVFSERVNVEGGVGLVVELAALG